MNKEIETAIQQLWTMRSIIKPTIDMLQASEDIETIQTNLNMLEEGINSLRVAPTPEEPPVEPIPVTFELESQDDIKITIADELDESGFVNIDVYGMDIKPTIMHPELFGNIKNASEIVLEFPVICGKTYTITQYNDEILSQYPDDPNISYVDGHWQKIKDYEMKRDTFEYSFLVTEGRNNILIGIDNPDNEEETYLDLYFNTHIHFVEEEENE